MSTPPSMDSSAEINPVCPHCMRENSPQAHFCVKCATPMSSLAAIDPLGRIQATGDTYRTAIHQSGPSKVTLVAM